MFKKIILLFLLLLFISPSFGKTTEEDKTRGFQITESEIKSPSWDSYMRTLEMKIRSNWKPSIKDFSGKIIAQFRVEQDGTVSSVKLIQPSEIKELDEAAIKAIEISSPFEPLPDDFKGSSVDINFTFDCKIFNGLLQTYTPNPAIYSLPKNDYAAKSLFSIRNFKR